MPAQMDGQLGNQKRGVDSVFYHGAWCLREQCQTLWKRTSLHLSPSLTLYRGSVLCNGGENAENVVEIQKAMEEMTGGYT